MAPPATGEGLYADLRASLAREAVNRRHQNVLHAAARRVRVLRGHLEAGLDLYGDDHRAERLVRSVLIHPEVRDALADLLVSLGGAPAAGEDRPAGGAVPDARPRRILELVRHLEQSLVAAGRGRREAEGAARRAAVELLGYLEAEVRRPTVVV